MVPSRAATFDMIRPATSTTAPAESGSGRAAPCTGAKRFCIVRASSTATHARLNRSAVQKNHRARSRATYMSTPGTSPGRSLAPRDSRQSRRQRKKIEMRFAHLKRILRLGRLRLRGPRGAQDEFVLAAIAQNLRRLARFFRLPHLTSFILLESNRVGGSKPVGLTEWPKDIRRLQPTFATKSAMPGHRHRRGWLTCRLLDTSRSVGL